MGLRPPGHHLVPHLSAVLVAGEAGRRIFPPQKKVIQRQLPQQMPQPPKRFVGDPSAGRVPGGEKHLRLGGKFLGRSVDIQGELPRHLQRLRRKISQRVLLPRHDHARRCEVGGKEIHRVMAHPKHSCPSIPD